MKSYSNRFFSLCAMLVVACAACTGTETGNPSETVELRRELITVARDNDGVFWVQGVANAATPLASVEVLDLSSTDDPIYVTADATGAFRTMLTSSAPDYVRLQAELDMQRSAPQDFLAGVGTSDTYVLPLSCLQPFTAGQPVKRELDAKNVGWMPTTFDMHNDCGFDVELLSVRLRAPQDEFTLDATTYAGILASGAQRDGAFTLTFGSGARRLLPTAIVFEYEANSMRYVDAITVR